jgi:hypothetical protein
MSKMGSATIPMSVATLRAPIAEDNAVWSTHLPTVEFQGRGRSHWKAIAKMDAIVQSATNPWRT